jgi:hypothetical protein
VVQAAAESVYSQVDTKTVGSVTFVGTAGDLWDEGASISPELAARYSAIESDPSARYYVDDQPRTQPEIQFAQEGGGAQTGYGTIQEGGTIKLLAVSIIDSQQLSAYHVEGPYFMPLSVNPVEAAAHEAGHVDYARSLGIGMFGNNPGVSDVRALYFENLVRRAEGGFLRAWH